MNKRIVSFMFIMLSAVFTAKVSYAGTDIINTVLLKASNVIDKVSQKYEGISVKVRELTEGKLFALDENTADMIQKAKDMKDSIQEKIDKVRAAKEFATNMDEAVLDRYNTILGQLEASDAQARSIVEQRGWTFGKDNADNDSDGDGYEKYYLGDRQVEIISKDSSSINISNNNDNKNTNNKIAGTSADSEYADSDDEYYYSGSMDDDYDDGNSGSDVATKDNSKQDSANAAKTSKSKENEQLKSSSENSVPQSVARKSFSSADDNDLNKKQVDVSQNLNKSSSSMQKLSPNKTNTDNSQKTNTFDATSKVSKETPANNDLKQQDVSSKDNISSAPSVKRKSFTSENAVSNGMEKSNVAKN
ncbi:MAG: hypothetical protein IKK52_06905 [Alphaproteobacteria bacterium]|nr:hypothetical protein [Alphaproteobacteria bacterium]